MLLLKQHDPRILVGNEHYDDAVVVQVNETTTLVQTVDFFTPVVDDPYHYGRIAAANSLSDVYAMGGQPITAMNIVCYPMARLGPQILSEILRGGGDTLREAGVLLAGGHTVEDAEPKFGLSVTGLIDPKKITTKGGLRPGDTLLLTKPLGTGVLTTAQKKGTLDPAHLQSAVEWMMMLNDVAAKAMSECGARAATDITGYGLIGHGFEMARASKARITLNSQAIPLLEGAWEHREKGSFPGGSAANRRWVENADGVTWGENVPEILRDLICDAQTSGGLLVGLPSDKAQVFLHKLETQGRRGWIIGSVSEGPAHIEVI